MSFIESYENNLVKFRFISKISSFLIAIFIMLEIGDFTNKLLLYPEFLNNNSVESTISLSFQTLIAILFIARFVLIWFKKTKFVWLSQLVWLFGWLAIAGYYSVTQIHYFGSIWGKREFSCMDCMYYDTFLYASTGLFIVLSFYVFFSPIKQIIMLATSFFTRNNYFAALS
jgi:hypothetical protein